MSFEFPGNSLALCLSLLAASVLSHLAVCSFALLFFQQTWSYLTTPPSTPDRVSSYTSNFLFTHELWIVTLANLGIFSLCTWPSEFCLEPPRGPSRAYGAWGPHRAADGIKILHQSAASPPPAPAAAQSDGSPQESSTGGAREANGVGALSAQRAESQSLVHND